MLAEPNVAQMHVEVRSGLGAKKRLRRSVGIVDQV
jgi:hypothetical protein